MYCVSADVWAEVEDGVGSDGAGVGGGDVEGLDLGALICVADVAEDGIRAGSAADDVLDVEIVVGVGGLEPGAAVVQVEVDRIGTVN